MFVLLYAPGTAPNDHTARNFEELADLFAIFDDVVIAKIDVNNNDIPPEYMDVGRIPGARFYPVSDYIAVRK